MHKKVLSCSHYVCPLVCLSKMDFFQTLKVGCNCVNDLFGAKKSHIKDTHYIILYILQCYQVLTLHKNQIETFSLKKSFPLLFSRPLQVRKFQSILQCAVLKINVSCFLYCCSPIISMCAGSILYYQIETFSPKGVWKKAKEKCEKNLLRVRSSVVRALVAKASGPGFESPATTKIFFFHIFPLLFFQTPLGEKVSIQFL